MTFEKAANAVITLKDLGENKEAMWLFDRFVNYFDLEGDAITEFAEMCEYPIATNVKVLND